MIWTGNLDDGIKEGMLCSFKKMKKKENIFFNIDRGSRNVNAME
jgi:hypothetical protein